MLTINRLCQVRAIRLSFSSKVIRIAGWLVCFNGITSFTFNEFQREACTRDTFVCSSQHILTLKVQNTQGDIYVTGWEKDSIQVVSTIQFETSNRLLACQLMNQFVFVHEIRSDQLNVHWHPKRLFSVQLPYWVQYHICVPVHTGLTIMGANGKLVLSNTDGPINVDLEKMEMRMSKCHSHDPVHIRALKSWVDLDEVNKVSLVANNSSFSLCRLNNLSVRSDFCNYRIKNVGHISFSGFFDHLYVDTVQNLIVSGYHCSVLVKELMHFAQIELNQGYLNVGSVSPDLKELNVANHMAPVEVTLLEDIPYYINGQVSQGAFICPVSKNIRVLNDQDITSFDGKSGEPDDQSARLILFNQSSSIQIHKETQ